jgi:hypothetical protein
MYPQYWMFVDEFGSPGRSGYATANERFLSLTGVIVSDYEFERFLTPQLEELKERHFGRMPDGTPIVLHRVDLLKGRPPFGAMRDAFKRAYFERELIDYLRWLDCTVVTVVLDKKAYEKQTGGEWRAHPYHLCMEVLLERFLMFLDGKGGQGRVVSEARGMREDQYLGRAVDYFYAPGNAYFDRLRPALRFPEGCVRTVPKSQNNAGLQVADLVTFSSFYVMYAKRFRVSPLTGVLKQIADVLDEGKYRTVKGEVEGYGQKWLPKKH